MEIIENSTLHYSPIEYSHEEFDGVNYHIYFAYNISETVTGVSDLQITVTVGPQPIDVTAEHCTHPDMVAQGNIYVIHIVLAKYEYLPDESCNRMVRVSGGWQTEELPIEIPISVQVLQIGCVSYDVFATFIDGNGQTLSTQLCVYGEPPVYTGETPTKQETEEYVYQFNGQWDPSLLDPILRNTTYIAQFAEIRKPIATFIDGDGNILTANRYRPGETVSYSGPTPTKQETEESIYQFNGQWNPSLLEPILRDTSYTAQFTEIVKPIATFIDGDGNTLITKRYRPGETVSYSGPTPTKTETSEYAYVFNGQWLPVLGEITADTTYVAQFDEIPKTDILFYVHPDEPIIDSKVPYELSGGASLVVRNSKYYVRLTSVSMFIKLELNNPMRIGDMIEIHTQQKYKPTITGTGTRSTHNSMELVGGEDSDYIYRYTIVGNAQDSRENLEGESTLYVWQSGSSTHIRSINIE